jgi:sulfonate transport system substrate-binding protein
MRWSLALFVALLALCACDRAQGVAAPSLSSSAALPHAFPRETRLALGDPAVQKQLELTRVEPLPFAIEWQNLSGGPQTIEAFRAGALDGGAVGDTPPIHAAFTGVDVKIIAVQQRADDRPIYELAIAPGSRIGSLADLRGARIAYSPGQAQGALVLRVLRKLGMRPADVQLVELTATEFKDALAARQVDVAPLSGSVLQRYLREYAAHGARSVPSGARDSLSFFYVRGDVLADAHKAAALREYVQLRRAAQLWASEHPEQWVPAYYVADQGLSASEARAVFESIGRPQYPEDWSEAIALTQETVDLLAEASGRAPFDAEALFDRRFEPAALHAAVASGSAR